MNAYFHLADIVISDKITTMRLVIYTIDFKLIL